MTTTPITEPPVAGDELDTLLGTLERNRKTFAWKCGGLDAAAMARTVGTSTVTLGGLVRHMATVERSSFSWKLFDREQPTEAEYRAGWNWTAGDDPDAAWTAWHAAVERSRELVAEALADGGLDRAEGHEFPGWGRPSLRRLITDMIEEYARHTGHADLIRESIDGLVGEDAPSA